MYRTRYKRFVGWIIEKKGRFFWKRYGLSFYLYESTAKQIKEALEVRDGISKYTNNQGI